MGHGARGNGSSADQRHPHEASENWILFHRHVLFAPSYWNYKSGGFRAAHPQQLFSRQPQNPTTPLIIRLSGATTIRSTSSQSVAHLQQQFLFFDDSGSTERG